MQQTNSYWRVLAVAAVAGALVASACVVTTSTDDSVGGAVGTGLPSSGGASTSTGGTPGASGGSTGGSGLGLAGNAASAVGGGGAVTFACDPDGGAVLGTPSSCIPASVSSCSTCVKAHCCTEFSNCYATNPGDQCGWGGPKGEGEIVCFQSCIIDSTDDGGVVDNELIGTCAAQCATPRDSTGMTCEATIGQQTNDLIACMNPNCSSECFGG